jgi:hypothetical protein
MGDEKFQGEWLVVKERSKRSTKRKEETIDEEEEEVDRQVEVDSTVQPAKMHRLFVLLNTEDKVN